MKSIYLNGVLFTTRTGPQAWDNMHGLLFGADEDEGMVGSHYNGQLDEIAVFDQPLTLAEVQALFDAGS